MTEAEFRAALEKMQDRIPEMACRVVPATFNPHEFVSAFPRPLEWRWESCEVLLAKFTPRVVMMRLPLFWQLESPLFAACKNAGASIFVNDQKNMPVGEAAIRLADVDTVVTNTDDAFTFSSYLSQKNTWPVSWIILHSWNTEWKLPVPLLEGGNIRVGQEVHLFPGVPLLIQCAALADEKKPRFHLSPEFDFQTTGPSLHIASRSDALLPFSDVEIPLVLKSDGTCSCEQSVFSRL